LLKTRKSGIPLLATYHPASVFRNRSFKNLLAEDIKKIPKIIESDRAQLLKE